MLDLDQAAGNLTSDLSRVHFLGSSAIDPWFPALRKNFDDLTRLRLLKLIRRQSGISRTELADRAGLTKSTVTAIVGEMIEAGLIEENVVPAVGRGRPRISLSIAKDRAHALAVFPLPDGTASIDIVNLQGERLFSSTSALGDLTDLVSLPARLTSCIEAAVAASKLDRTSIGGVGVVIPGHVDRHEGVIHWLPPAAPHVPMPLGGKLSKLLGLPVTLENRASILARAEHWFGEDGGQDDFTLIALMELGMGAARYAGGTLQSGFHGMNSEFGHVKVAFEGGRACHCGGTGCLVTYASAIGIVTSTGLAGDLPRDAAAFSASFDRTVEDALRGKTAAVAAFDLAGKALGTAIASHVNEQDPGRVVVQTLHPHHGVLMEPALRKAVSSQILPSLLERTSIRLQPVDEDDIWKGSASLALERIYTG